MLAAVARGALSEVAKISIRPMARRLGALVDKSWNLWDFLVSCGHPGLAPGVQIFGAIRGCRFPLETPLFVDVLPGNAVCFIIGPALATLSVRVCRWTPLFILVHR